MCSPEKLGSIENTYEETQVEWKITDFWKTTKDEKFTYHNSPFFTFSNFSWFFQFYPKSKIIHECIAFYLGCGGGLCGEKSVEYTLGLKRGDNDVEHLVAGIMNRPEKFSAVNHVKRSEIIQRKCELLPDDVLTIFCILKHGTIHSTQSKHESTKKEMKKLISK